MKISVENLPVDITEDRLKDVFGQIGEVQSVKLKTDLFTWQPNGHGIVDMTLDVWMPTELSTALKAPHSRTRRYTSGKPIHCLKRQRSLLSTSPTDILCRT